MLSPKTFNIISSGIWAFIIIPMAIYANTRFFTAFALYLLLVVAMSNMSWK